MNSHKRIRFAVIICFLLSTALSFGQQISAANVKTALYVSNALFHVKQGKRYDLDALYRFVVLQYQRYPNTNPDAVTKILGQAEAQFQKQYGYNPNSQTPTGLTQFDTVRAMFNILAHTPGVYIQDLLAQDELSWTRTVFPYLYNAQDILLSQAGQYDSYVSADTWRAKSLTSLQVLATKSVASFAVDTFFGPIFNANIEDSASTILNNNPALTTASNTFSYISQNLDANGNFNDTVANVKSQVTAQLSAISNATNDAINVMGQIDQYQQVFTEFLGDGNSQNIVQQLAQTELSDDQDTFDGGLPGVFALQQLLTSVPGGAFQSFANTIFSIGSASDEIGSSISDFVQSSSDIADTIGSVISIGADIMTGNIVGAALDAFGLFGGSGPSQDSQIEQGIQQIQQEIQNLSQQMNSRFDRIDSELNQIYTSLNNDFSQLSTLIQNVQATAYQIQLQLNEVREALFSIESSLDRLQENMYSLISASVQIDLNNNITAALNYPLTHPISDPMSYDDFINYYNYFYSWATTNAYNATLTGGDPSTRTYQDWELAETELATNPLEDNLDYLLRLYPSYWNSQGASIPTMTSAPMPNPRYWELSGEAIENLFSAWPANYQILSSLPNWSANTPNATIYALDQIGEGIQLAISNVTLLNPYAYSGLFGFLNTRYSNDWNSFVNDAQTLRGNLVTTPPYSYNSNLDIYNPYGPATSNYQLQGTWWIEWRPQYPPYGVEQGSGQIPNVLDSYIPVEFKLLEMLGVGHVEVYETLLCGQTSSGSWEFEDVFLATFENSNGNLTASNNWAGPAGNLVYPHTIESWGLVYPTSGFVDPGTYYNDNQNQIWSDIANHNNIEYGFSPSFYNFPSFFGSSDYQSIYNSIGQTINAVQTADHDTLINNLSQTGNVATDGESLNGIKEILTDYIAIGLPKTLETSDLLRSLLYGGSWHDSSGNLQPSESLIDTAGISAQYQSDLAILQASNQNWVSDPLTTLSNIEATRLGTLYDQVLQPRLQEIASTGVTEGQRMVDTEVGRIQMYEQVGQTYQVSPPTLTLSPSTVEGGSTVYGTVSVPGLGSDPMSISLTQPSFQVQFPAYVEILPNQTQARFDITTYPVTQQKTVTITATGVGKGSATLTILPTLRVASLKPSVTKIVGGNNLTCTMTLAGPAGPGGAPVYLTTSNPVVTCASGVVIPYKQTTYTFTIKTTAVTAPTMVNISANAGGTNTVTTIEVDP